MGGLMAKATKSAAKKAVKKADKKPDKKPEKKVAKKPAQKASPKPEKQAAAKPSNVKTAFAKAKVEKKPVLTSKAVAPKTEAKKPAKKPAEKPDASEKVETVVTQPVVNVTAQMPALLSKDSAKEKKAEPVVAKSTVVAPKEKSPAKSSGEKKAKRSGKGMSLSIDKMADLGAQWNSLFEKSKNVEAVPYRMTDTFEARTPIMHKVLGWGFVLSSQNDRLEVLFKDGIRILISNYKG